MIINKKILRKPTEEEIEFLSFWVKTKNLKIMTLNKICFTVVLFFIFIFYKFGFYVYDLSNKSVSLFLVVIISCITIFSFKRLVDEKEGIENGEFLLCDGTLKEIKNNTNSKIADIVFQSKDKSFENIFTVYNENLRMGSKLFLYVRNSKKTKHINKRLNYICFTEYVLEDGKEKLFGYKEKL